MTDRQLADDLAAALEELRALVRGECPSLLNEDSGGDANLDMQIDKALAAYRAQREGEGYRMLKAGEIIEDGDQCGYGGIWGETQHIGKVIDEDDEGNFRRPLTKGEA